MFLPVLLPLIDSLRVYSPPDPPGYFDGHVWPMYLKNRQEMENMVSGIGGYPFKGTVCTVCESSVGAVVHLARCTSVKFENK